MDKWYLRRLRMRGEAQEIVIDLNYHRKGN
jgi:hypothetical protein